MSADLTARASAAKAQAEGVRHLRIAIVADGERGRVMMAGSLTLHETLQALAALTFELTRRLGTQDPNAPAGDAKVPFRPPRVA